MGSPDSFINRIEYHNIINTANNISKAEKMHWDINGPSSHIYALCLDIPQGSEHPWARLALLCVWLTRGDLCHNPLLRATDILLPWTPNKNQSEEQQIITRCVHIWSPSHQSVSVPSLSRDDAMLSISTGGAGSITVTLSKCHHDVFSRECLFLLYSKLCKYLWKVTRDHQWCLDENIWASFKNIH